MKKLLLASAALMALSTASFAADLPARAAPMAPVAVAPVFTWTGFYVGLVGTGGQFNWDANDFDENVTYGPTNFSGFGGGIGGTVGANLQWGSAVFGIEADGSWVSFEEGKRVTYSGDLYSVDERGAWDALVTVRGRVGLAFDRTMAFITGGVAFVDTNYRLDDIYDGEFDEGYRHSGWETGFAIGAGVEHAFTNNITLKAEYLYVGLPTVESRLIDDDGDVSEDGEDFARFRSNAHLGRIGLNFKF